jgi:hypothetical protein
MVQQEIEWCTVMLTIVREASVHQKTMDEQGRRGRKREISREGEAKHQFDPICPGPKSPLK